MAELDKTEFWKAQIEYYKHLTTLSTGSIVLIATFLEKLFTNPLWKPAIIVSIIGFLISVISSVLAYTLIVEYKFPGAVVGEKDLSIIGKLSDVLTWAGFIVGISFLAAFTIKNLLS